jgi:hypothetical protein
VIWGFRVWGFGFGALAAFMADSDAPSAAVESAPASTQTEESPSTIPARNVTTHVQGEPQVSTLNPKPQCSDIGKYVHQGLGCMSVAN